MSKWEEKRFEEIVEVNPITKLKKGKEYAFIDIDKVSPILRTVSNVETKTYDGQSCSKFCKGDTVFSRITPCLENRKIAQVDIATDAGFGSTEFYVFRARENKSDENFIYYLGSSDVVVPPAINSMSGASGRQRADKRFIERLKMTVPDLSTQKRIADILSAYDDLIENNNKRIALLEKAAQELYKEWFVRFRFPGYEQTEFENGIPKGWGYIKFGEILSFERGISYSSDEIDCDNGINLINLKNIEAFGGFRRDGTKNYNGNYRKAQVVVQNDLVLGVTDMTQDRRTVGAVALIPTIKGTSVISADLVKVISDIPNQYLYCLCKYGFYSKYFAQFANGANVLHLKPNTLLKKKLLLPTKELIYGFVEKVYTFIELADRLNLDNDNLVKQRDLLLPRLISGKLEVDIDAVIKEETKTIISFDQFNQEFKFAARADNNLTEDDIKNLYEAYCNDKRKKE